MTERMIVTKHFSSVLTILLLAFWGYPQRQPSLTPHHPPSPQHTYAMVAQEDVSARVGVRGARRMELVAENPLPERPFVLTMWVSPERRPEAFLMRPLDVFAPDARLKAVTWRGVSELARPDVRLYCGRSSEQEDHFLFLSMGRDEWWAVLWRGDRTSVVFPSISEKGPIEVMVDQPVQRATVGEAFCHTEVVAGTSTVPGELLENPPVAFSTAASDRLEAEIMVDVDYGLYSRTFGKDMTRITTYVANLYGTVSAIYQRDVNVQLRITHLTIWTRPDPFAGIDAVDQLIRYRQYMSQTRKQITRDVAQLLDDQWPDGGAAYEATLCNSTYGYSVCNLKGNVHFPVQDFVEDVYLVAHELGHNFGSPHTHCYSPPIDRCYGQEPFCYNGPSIPTTGTIMSFCHLTPAGATLNFHPRVIALIRAEAEAAECLERVPAGELAVDDGTFETAFRASGRGSVSYVNRLTPAVYPATLAEVAIFFPGDAGMNVGDSLSIVIGTNPGGSATLDGIAFQTIEASVSSLDQFNVYDVPELSITSGDFVVGFRVRSRRGVKPCAVDQTPPSQGRSYISTDGVHFTLVDEAVPSAAGNFGIRGRLKD